MMADVEHTPRHHHDHAEDESAEYKGHEHKYIPMRIVLVALMTVLSIVLKDHFSDLADFVGASAISISCIILPILFYFKKLWTEIPIWEKAAGSVVVLVCLVLGCYVTFNTGKALISPEAADPNAPAFPFCHEEFKFELYYNASAVGSL